jgi:MFS family permease
MLFAGWAIAAFIFPRLADIYGRRLIFTGSMLIQTLSLIGLYFSTNLYVTYAFMFFFGSAAVGRCAVGYLYLMEILPKA